MTAITPGSPRIPMRSSFSNTSTDSMTNQMLQEIKDKPGTYNTYDNSSLKNFLTETCTAMKNSETHGPQKTLTAVYKEMEAYLKKKDQRDPTVIKVQQALTDLLKTFQRPTLKAQADKTSTPMPNHGFRPSSIITAAKSTFSLSTRIKEGIFSPSDLETISDLTALADPVVQRRVLKGILRGKIVAEVPEGPGARLINLMKKTVIPTLSANDQADILQLKDGHDHALGVLLREHPQCIRFFTAPGAQRDIASTIRRANFKNDLEVLIAVTENVEMFTDENAQKEIASAISEDKFGNWLKVLEFYDQTLSMLTDPKAKPNPTKEKIEQAKQTIEVVFGGQPPQVLKAVAKNAKIFTDLLIEKREIAAPISQRNLGKNTEGLPA